MKFKILPRKSFLVKVLTVFLLPFVCLMIALFVQSCKKDNAIEQEDLQKSAISKYEKSFFPFKTKLEKFYAKNNLAKVMASASGRKKIMGLPTGTPPPPSDDPNPNPQPGDPQPYPISTPSNPFLQDPPDEDAINNIATETEAKAILDPMIASSIEFLHSYDVTDADIIQACGSLTDSRIPAAAEEAYVAAVVLHERNANMEVSKSNAITSLFVNGAYAKLMPFEITNCIFESLGLNILADLATLTEGGGAISFAMVKACVRTTFMKTFTRLAGPIGAAIFCLQLSWCIYGAYND